MDDYEWETGQPRKARREPLDFGTPGTADYLQVTYDLPDPCTLEEFRQALADLNERWARGERTENPIATG